MGVVWGALFIQGGAGRPSFSDSVRGMRASVPHVRDSTMRVSGGRPFWAEGAASAQALR